jgi:dTDP-4-amino-4,6-dideoxygalactose transaminase
LLGIPGLTVFAFNDREHRNYQHVVVEIDDRHTGITRDLLIRLLHAENVLARRYFYPGCHRMEPYRSDFPDAGLVLPETEALCNRVLILPTGTTVSESDVAKICGLVRMAIENAAAITKRSQSAVS